MVAWLDKLTDLSSSVRAEVSSPESSKKETTQLGFVGGIEDAYAAKFLDNGQPFHNPNCGRVADHSRS